MLLSPHAGPATHVEPVTNVGLLGAARLGIMAGPPCDKHARPWKRARVETDSGPSEGVLFE